MTKKKVYLASGWFTKEQESILNDLENMLTEAEFIDLYSPRRDGVELPANQKHDIKLREKVFKDNIYHIEEADLVVANVDSSGEYNDPGTMYEIGYAMSRNIPVVGYARSSENVIDRFEGITEGFECILLDMHMLYNYLNEYEVTPRKSESNKVLFVGSGNYDVDSKLVTHLLDNDVNLRWLSEDRKDIYTNIDSIFSDVSYMLVVIDDRRTLCSWMIGQAWSRGIPVVTYSDFNYGINVMLLLSILTHIKGTDELDAFLQKVNRNGLSSIELFDIEDIKSM